MQIYHLIQGPWGPDNSIPATITYFGRVAFTMFGDMRMGDCLYSEFIQYKKRKTLLGFDPLADV